MKTSTYLISIMLSTLIIIPQSLSGQSLSAKEIVKKADEKMKGEESSKSVMKMKIIRPTWERTISFKSWTKGTEYSLALVTAPAQEKGQSFLKHKNEMWQWNPDISRMIKLPPSMMSQGWMGSDYTNDDILKESSIVVDYNHKILGSEKIEGYDCYKIELVPKEKAAVVWGKIVMWISKDLYLQMKSEYYDEEGYLVKTELAYDIKEMDGRKIPTKFEIIPADEEKQKTVVRIEDIEFNVNIPDSFFSQQNMKRVR